MSTERPVVTTADPTLRRLADGLLTEIPTCIGGYLHGSTGRGQLRPQSDLDVLVVTDAPLSAEEREALVTFLLGTSGRYPRPPAGHRPIELTIVVRSEVQPWRYPPRCELQYGEWLRAGVEAGRPLESFTSPDLALLLAMVLACDAPIFGPPPGDVLDPVPASDVRRATVDAVPDLISRLDTDATNVLLTLARAWHTAVTGAVVSKDEAAAWAARRAFGSVRPILDRARTAYLDGTVHEWGRVDDDTRRAARFLGEAVAGVQPRPGPSSRWPEVADTEPPTRPPR